MDSSGRSDASTSTDDVKDRPLCLFYFTHPFGVLSPEPPTLAAAPAHVARAFLNMEPVSPFAFWGASAASGAARGEWRTPAPAAPAATGLRPRRCTLDSLSSSLFSTDVWFDSTSDVRCDEYPRRLIPYNRILPPLSLPNPKDSGRDSADALWPIMSSGREKFSLPPIELPSSEARESLTTAARAEVGRSPRREAPPARGRRAGAGAGVRKPRRAARALDVRRLLARLTHRALSSGSVGAGASPAHTLRDALRTVRAAWPEHSTLRSGAGRLVPAGAGGAFPAHRYHAAARRTPTTSPAVNQMSMQRESVPGACGPGPAAASGARAAAAPVPPARPGASPGLLCRRYSVPETIMRKYRLAQHKLDTDDIASGTGHSPAATSAGESPQRTARLGCDQMRRSALLRGRFRGGTGPAGCECCESSRSLDGSRVELRPPSRRTVPRSGLDCAMLRAAVHNSFERAEDSRQELSYCTFRSHELALSSCACADATDTEGSKFKAGSAEAGSSDVATLDICRRSELDSSALTTALEDGGSTSVAAYAVGRGRDKASSGDDDALPYHVPVETPSYELLEIVVSETIDSSAIPAFAPRSPDEAAARRPSVKALPLDHRFMRSVNIDEYVSNILVESLNSLTDQLECMNASIAGDRKISIVEKEIKVKLQNTGVNTIVHLSPTSNNQIIFGNEELCNEGEGAGRSAAGPGASSAARRSPSIREERAPGDSGDEAGDAFDLRHEHVNEAVLHQIQKLFQNELHNLDSDIGYRGEVLPEISHIEISNVDVFLDSHREPSLAPVDTLRVHASRKASAAGDAAGGVAIGGVRAGNYFGGVGEARLVPRYCALPHSASMEVHASSSEDAELLGSDCTSLVDSLDDPNSPRSILSRKSCSNRRHELVRSAIDVLDLLPENANDQENFLPKDKGESFFIKIEDAACDRDEEDLRVADRMPEKIKQRLYRRQRKRELRMESARRGRARQLQRSRLDDERRRRTLAARDCRALVGALIDDVIARVAQDEYNCMRVMRAPDTVGSKSDEIVAKRSWKRKETQRVERKDSRAHFRNGFVRLETTDAERDRYSSEGRICGKLSFLTRPSLAPERGPKRIYQKSEIHEGNKCIEILEILEYVHGSASTPETTPDENQNQKTKKSRIPIPVHEKVLKSNNNSHGCTGKRRSPPPPPPPPQSPQDCDANANRSVADAPPRARSNSLRFRQTFDMIPEERSAPGAESGPEDGGLDRRASAPDLGAIAEPRARASPLAPAPSTRSRSTMTSPRGRLAAPQPRPRPALQEGSKVRVTEPTRERRAVHAQAAVPHTGLRRNRATGPQPPPSLPPEPDRPALDEARHHKGTHPDSFREHVQRSTVKSESPLPDECSEEPEHSVKLAEFQAGGSDGGSSSSGSGGSLLCALAPQWLARARRRRAVRHRHTAQPAPRAPAPAPDWHPAPDGSGGGAGAGGWSVTVAGSCRAALPADVEMRLRFPHEHAQEWSCAHCATCACPGRPPRASPPALPAAARALPAAPPAHLRLAPTDTGKLMLTMKKEARDSSIVASKSRKKTSDAADTLPELETFRASRTKLRSSVKTRRGCSLHCWLPDTEPAPIRERDGLSVLGCAIVPELKPRARSMSERDLTRRDARDTPPPRRLRC